MKGMVMFQRKKLLLCATALAIGGGAVLLNSFASADLFTECEIRPGNTRFYDFASDHCGYVSGNNANWGSLPGGWNDRADQFGNDGNTSSNCLYQDASCSNTRVLLPRGFAVRWDNIVSSNRWTTASACPTGC
jgi:hypothetical protein